MKTRISCFGPIVAICVIMICTLTSIETASIDQIIEAAGDESDNIDMPAADENPSFNAAPHGSPSTVKVELDMLFKKEDWKLLQELDKEAENTSPVTSEKRKASKSLVKRWSKSVVPYTISSSFTKDNVIAVWKAMADWNHYTCLYFRPRQLRDKNYVHLQNGRGCSSYIGSIGGRQTVNLASGCRQKGIIIHELGHAIGFFHEQSRPDRDDYITIEKDNIKPRALGNFLKHSPKVINTYNVPYDYGSVMHYGSYYFSTNKKITIKTKNPRKQKVIGNRKGLSFMDVKLANAMYGCSYHCPQNITCPDNGFLGKDCQCYCRGKWTPAVLCDERGKEECVGNLKTSCQLWANQGYCVRSKKFMQYNCEDSCGYCVDDKYSKCRSYAEKGWCSSKNSKTKTFMKTYCPLSCHFYVPKCLDLLKDCPKWKKQGYCFKGYQYQCGRSCGTC